MTEAEREHPLMVNLLRIGLSRQLADQVIAEVEDSVWLAEHDEETGAEVKRLRGENAEYVRAHELMVVQFKTMQREKEHGWREAERWEAKAEALRAELARQAEQITAVRALHYEVVVPYMRSAGVTHRSECGECGYGIFPCATIEALDGTS